MKRLLLVPTLPVLAAFAVVLIVVSYATGLLAWDRSVIGLLAVAAIGVASPSR